MYIDTELEGHWSGSLHLVGAAVPEQLHLKPMNAIILLNSLLALIPLKERFINFRTPINVSPRIGYFQFDTLDGPEVSFHGDMKFLFNFADSSVS